MREGWFGRVVQERWFGVGSAGRGVIWVWWFGERGTDKPTQRATD